MKRLILFFLPVGLCTIFFIWLTSGEMPHNMDEDTAPIHGVQPAASTPMSLASSELQQGQMAPKWMAYDSLGCMSENRSPALSWAGGPAGTQSYALTMFDPDAGDGRGWLHWFVLDIPANITSLAPHAGYEDDSGLPRGAHSVTNSYGKTGYGGPCPPEGAAAHDYVFTIYAMPNATTAYPLNAIGKPTINWLAAHAKASATFTVTYRR